ncbi:MAG: YbjN domain-containing protein [Caulobacteraceae bacterium]|nr:YbjN domain-containing protein [Caulobacteraceae bacterium]
MIRSLFVAASIAFSLGAVAPGDASAQEATSVAPAFVGLTPESVRDWLSTAGAQVGDVTRDGGDVFFRVDDAGLVWFVFFYGCEADGRCGDVQFNAVFNGQGVTAEEINGWNREQRFLKAFVTEAEGEPVVFMQFDVLITSGLPVEQMADPTIVWLEGLNRASAFLEGVGDAPTT